MILIVVNVFVEYHYQDLIAIVRTYALRNTFDPPFGMRFISVSLITYVSHFKERLFAGFICFDFHQFVCRRQEIVQTAYFYFCTY